MGGGRAICRMGGPERPVCWKTEGWRSAELATHRAGDAHVVDVSSHHEQNSSRHRHKSHRQRHALSTRLTKWDKKPHRRVGVSALLLVFGGQS